MVTLLCDFVLWIVYTWNFATMEHFFSPTMPLVVGVVEHLIYSSNLLPIFLFILCGILFGRLPSYVCLYFPLIPHTNLVTVVCMLLAVVPSILLGRCLASSLCSGVDDSAFCATTANYSACTVPCSSVRQFASRHCLWRRRALPIFSPLL